MSLKPRIFTMFDIEIGPFDLAHKAKIRKNENRSVTSDWPFWLDSDNMYPTCFFNPDPPYLLKSIR